MSIWNKLRGNARSGSRLTSELEETLHDQRLLESTSASLQKAAKKLADTIQEYDRNRARYIEMLDTLAFFKTDPPADEHDRFRAGTDAVGHLTKTLQGNILGTVHDPIKRFSKMFPGVNEHIKHHERMAVAYERAQQKFEKLRGNPGTDAIKLDRAERELHSAEKNWEASEATLPIELPRLYAKRIDFIEPCFQAFLAAQYRYFADVHADLSTLCGDDNTQEDQKYIDQTLLLLDDLEKLSIVGTQESNA
eukprot:m.294606 g.294606  ORF g.294606 m.294606 type:complete len:250 (-) comp13029_c0_seq1:109-858(-)